MTERPILFGGEMVRAIIDGRKTVTRRPVKPQPDANCVHATDEPGVWEFGWVDGMGEGDLVSYERCPYGVPGDRLWVKEAYRVAASLDSLRPSELPPDTHVHYETAPRVGGLGRYRHARFMPRWASRITLDVVDVSIERVQEITYDEMLDEGIIPRTGGVETTYPFAKRWDALYDDGPYGWVSNPWVWAVSFRRVES